jgi:uncharacterized protein YyaL (SSP411 family)
MTVFLTPDREPFHGGTYFPPTDRHGLPAFPRVLETVARAFRERPADVARAVDQIKAGILGMDEVSITSGPFDPELPRRVADALLDNVDPIFGGLGRAPKFPNTSAFQLLLRQAMRAAMGACSAVQLTCRRMAGGHLRSIGAVHRYSVDQRWLVPRPRRCSRQRAIRVCT